MATITFRNGTEGDYGNPASWAGGVAPAAGDTAVIDSTGDAPATLTFGEKVFAFPVGDTAADLTNAVNVEPPSILVQEPGTTNPVVYFQYFPDVAAGSQNTPGETISNQTIDLIGGGSVASLYLQNSTLGATTGVNVSGTAVVFAQFSDQLDGTISVGGTSLTEPAAVNANNNLNELDIVVRPTGSWTYNNGAYTLSGEVPSVTNSGVINVAANSALNIQLVAANESLFQDSINSQEPEISDFQPTRTDFVNDGTINVAAGGNANIYGAPAILDNPSAEDGGYVPAPFLNNGTINVDGAVGATTSFTADQSLVGGTLNVDGGNATDPAATTAQIADGETGANIVITDATLDLVEHNHDINTPQFADQFTGGSITFADDRGVLAFPASSLTNPEIDTIVGDISTPVDGFRAGDAIDVTLVPGVNSKISTEGTFSFAPVWDQANNQLQIVETVAIDSIFGGGTASQTVAALTLNGTYDPSSFHVTWSPDPFNEAFSTGSQAVTLTVTTTSTAPCFVAGTRIATLGGDTPVEDLRPGDRVLLADGTTAQVRWVGHRRVDGTLPDQAPIRIRAGALGPNLPRRDLCVSPDHALFLDGVLVPAELLVNDMIVRDPPRRVAYHHVELAHHAILLAEGAPAESYLDTGNRARFANCPLAYDPIEAAASDPCAEVIFGGPRLDRIRARLRPLQPAL